MIPGRRTQVCVAASSLDGRPGLPNVEEILSRLERLKARFRVERLTQSSRMGCRHDVGGLAPTARDRNSRTGVAINRDHCSGSPRVGNARAR